MPSDQPQVYVGVVIPDRPTGAVGPPCSTDRVLWACGAGLHGQLGLVDTVCRLVPARVGEEEAFGPSKVLTITCGHNHSMAVTEEGGPVLIDRKSPPFSTGI